MGRGERVVGWIRRVGLPLVFVAAFVGFGALVLGREPLGAWLFPRYAAYWLLSLIFAAACLSSGHALVRRVLGGHVLPLLEHLSVAFAAGVYLFFLGMTIGGLLHLYGVAFFVALPLVLIGSGARPGFRYARRAARHLRGAWRRSQRPPPWSLAVHAFGLLGLLCVYFSALSPDNAAFDARWYHLGLAEHYAAAGAVQRFPEGWYAGTWPHLGSLLYTWAFLLPKAELFDHVELCAHLEVTIFLFSIFGLPALVRRLIPAGVAGRGAYRYAWAARFLFPGVLVYDSSLSLGADHIAAVFAVPIYAMLLRAWRSLSPRACALLAIALSGAFLTKYTSALLLVTPAIVLVALRALMLAARGRIRRRDERLPLRTALAGPLVATAACLLLTAPHWLKNLVWYGNPLYPALHGIFPSHPWTVDTAARYEIGFSGEHWRPDRNLHGVVETLKALFTFSFFPNDWTQFHGDAPVFGSLFTLSLAALPFLRRTRRIWGLYAATHIGLVAWYWVHHQDRYLQAIVPWMAAATVAVLGLVFRQGLAAQLTAGALVALQIVWGADVYFMPAHAYNGIPAKRTIDLLTRTQGQPVPANRFRMLDSFDAVGRILPRGAKPLLHSYHFRLGFGAPSVVDCPNHQGGISYLRTPTPREVFDQLHGYGVTHIVNRAPLREADTLGGEIVFANFVQRLGAPKTADGWQVYDMPREAPPPGGAPDPVLVVTCGKELPPGLYHLADLAVPSLERGKPSPAPFTRAAPNDLASLVPQAMALAQAAGCPVPPAVKGRFVQVTTREPYAIWVRR